MVRYQKCSWEGCEWLVAAKDFAYMDKKPHFSITKKDGFCGPHMYLNALFCGWPDEKVILNVDEYLYWRRMFFDDEFFNWVNRVEM